jgi:hypothetical protein
VPEVDQSMEREFTTLDDPWEIRDQFLRLKHTEEATVKFLTQIGVWNAAEDRHVTAASTGKMLMSGSFGHRWFFGRALPVTLEELWAKQTMWKNLLSDPDRLRAGFSPPPPQTAAPFEKADFASKAAMLNTLPLHIDWQLQRRRQPDGQISTAIEPLGIIQPFTGWELLVATTHMDLLRRAQFQICARPDCAIPFTGRQRQFCRQYCGHLESVRKKRRGEKQHGKRR